MARVRANLVRPYCRFLALTAPRSPEVASACELPAAERHPVPLYAVLGNHDYLTPGSVELRARRAVPLFLANWRMPEGGAAVAELGHGVSLVLFESDPVFRGAAPEGSRARCARPPVPGASWWRTSRSPWSAPASGRRTRASGARAGRDRGGRRSRAALPLGPRAQSAGAGDGAARAAAARDLRRRLGRAQPARRESAPLGGPRRRGLRAHRPGGRRRARAAGGVADARTRARRSACSGRAASPRASPSTGTRARGGARSARRQRSAARAKPAQRCSRTAPPRPCRRPRTW